MKISKISLFLNRILRFPKATALFLSGFSIVSVAAVLKLQHITETDAWLATGLVLQGLGLAVLVASLLIRKK